MPCKQIENDVFTRIRNGETIGGSDPQGYRLREESYATKLLVAQMNNAKTPQEIREILARITTSAIDESVNIFTPLYINYGKHTTIGKNVFINFDCIFLDLGGITIEDNVLVGPRVSLLTEGHPLERSDRHSLIAKPIHIRKNAWIGAGAIILQGVTIGENAVVAAGSVVSGDVADNTVVGGIPGKMIKMI